VILRILWVVDESRIVEGMDEPPGQVGNFVLYGCFSSSDDLLIQQGSALCAWEEARVGIEREKSIDTICVCLN
jgi:hypothetical protein